MQYQAREKGITLIEVLIFIVIMTILLTIVFLSLSKLNASQALDKGAALVAATLDEARSLTLSAKNDNQYGVYFDASSTVLFGGSVYLPGDPNNVETVLNSKIGIRNINLSGGGSAVIFERLTGNTSQTGTLEVFLIEASTTFRTITIKATGVVELD